MRDSRPVALAVLFVLAVTAGFLNPFRAGPAAASTGSGPVQGAPGSLPPTMTPGSGTLAGEWPLVNLQAKALWSLAPAEGSGVPVAVVDTGIDARRPDLAGAVSARAAAARPDQPSDSHGTEIAELIAGRPLAKDPVTGLAPRADLIDIPVTTDANQVTASQIVKGITQAVSAHARIINVSLGVWVPEDSKAYHRLQDAVKDALDHGCLVVASVGSLSVTRGGKGALYPADTVGAVAVAATNQSMKPMGILAGHGQFAVFAPGDDVTAVDNQGKDRELSGNGFAAAYVSAAAALIWAAYPTLTASRLAELLVTETDPPSSSTQRGVIDPLQILRELAGYPQTPAGQGPAGTTGAGSPAGATPPAKHLATGSRSRLLSLGITVVVAGAAIIGGLLGFAAYRNRKRPPGSGGGPGSYLPFDWDLEPR